VAAAIINELMELTDLTYASARKEFYVRGGFITVKDIKELYEEIGSW
jgi:hypothetical protein